ncbi:MAG: FHA domain-containing protein [Planctomycetota bacterium]
MVVFNPEIDVQDHEFPEFAGKYGQLTPIGGGDPIPLIKERLTIGRRPSCDIQLKFSNVSSSHCQMRLESGYWFIKDLQSVNGTKVDDHRIMRKRADPKCKVSIAKHHYILEYEPQALGAFGPPPADDDYIEELMKSSLMQRAGLKRRDDSKKYANRNELEE